MSFMRSNTGMSWLMNSNFHRSSRDLRSHKPVKTIVKLETIPKWPQTYEKLQKEAEDNSTSSSEEEVQEKAAVASNNVKNREVIDVDDEDEEHDDAEKVEGEESEEGEQVDESMEDPTSTTSASASKLDEEEEVEDEDEEEQEESFDDEEEEEEEEVNYSVNPSLNSKIRLYQGDITCLQVDAVVNAANSGLWSGGGICGAIFQAACEWKLERECKRIIAQSGKVKPGESRLTKAYELPAAKFIIHTVGPMNEDERVLRNAYRSLLQTVAEPRLSVNGEKVEIKTVAVCCISTGIYGMENEIAANVALRTTREWLESNEAQAKKIDSIIFCTFLQKDQIIYEHLLPKYFPVEEEHALDANEASTSTSASASNEKQSEKKTIKKQLSTSSSSSSSSSAAAASSSSSSSVKKHNPSTSIASFFSVRPSTHTASTKPSFSAKSTSTSAAAAASSKLKSDANSDMPPIAAPLLTKRKSEEEMKDLEPADAHKKLKQK